MECLSIFSYARTFIISLRAALALALSPDQELSATIYVRCLHLFIRRVNRLVILELGKDYARIATGM